MANRHWMGDDDEAKLYGNSSVFTNCEKGAYFIGSELRTRITDISPNSEGRFVEIWAAVCIFG